MSRFRSISTALSLCMLALLATGESARAQATVRVPTQGELAAFLLRGPHRARVEARGRVVNLRDVDEFSMTGAIEWNLGRRADRIVLDQRAFSGWSGDLAPAALSSLWILPELDPVLDADWSVLAIEGPLEAATRVRAGIAAARGEPSGSAQLFAAALSERGMTLAAGDFFAPLAAWVSRPADGERVVLGTAPTTPTPFGVLDVPTTHALVAHDRVACDDADRNARCLDLVLGADADPSALATAAGAALGPNLPEGARLTNFVLSYQVRLVVRPAPLAVVRLEATRRSVVTFRESPTARDRDLTATESTYSILFEGAPTGR